MLPRCFRSAETFPSPVEHALAFFVVALPRRRPARGDRLNSSQVVYRQSHPRSGHVLLEALDAARTGDWHDIVAAGEHPGERELGRRAALFPRNLSDPIGHRQVLRGVFTLKARIATTPIVGGEVLDPLAA